MARKKKKEENQGASDKRPRIVDLSFEYYDGNRQRYATSVFFKDKNGTTYEPMYRNGRYAENSKDLLDIDLEAMGFEGNYPFLFINVKDKDIMDGGWSISAKCMDGTEKIFKINQIRHYLDDVVILPTNEIKGTGFRFEKLLVAPYELFCWPVKLPIKNGFQVKACEYAETRNPDSEEIDRRVFVLREDIENLVSDKVVYDGDDVIRFTIKGKDDEGFAIELNRPSFTLD